MQPLTSISDDATLYAPRLVPLIDGADPADAWGILNAGLDAQRGIETLD